MTNTEFKQIENMLAVIYKMLDDMKREAKGSYRHAPMHTYLEELKQEAQRIQNE